MSHHFSYRVSPADTDVGGIVYYVNYLKIAERAREALLAEHGFDAANLAVLDQPQQLTVSACEVKYIASARMGDEVSVVTTCVAVDGERLRLSQQVFAAENLLVRLEIELACIALATQQVRPLPAQIKQLFSNAIAN